MTTLKITTIYEDERRQADLFEWVGVPREASMDYSIVIDDKDGVDYGLFRCHIDDLKSAIERVRKLLQSRMPSRRIALIMDDEYGVENLQFAMTVDVDE